MLAGVRTYMHPYSPSWPVARRIEGFFIAMILHGVSVQVGHFSLGSMLNFFYRQISSLEYCSTLVSSVYYGKNDVMVGP